MLRTMACLLLVAFAGAAAASDSPIPRLGDHTFVPVTTLVEPFITTTVQVSIGIGNSVNTTVPLFDLENQAVLGSVKADIFLASIGFRYQHAAKDWLAVFIDLNTAGRLGTSTTSMISDGVTGVLAHSLGWLVRIHQFDDFLLSGTLSLGNRDATFVSMLDWVTGVIQGPDVPLVRSRHSLSGGGGLHAAWGLSRRFGLLGKLGSLYGESFDGTGNNAWRSDVILAVSYDAEHDLTVPLGLAISGGYFDDDRLGQDDRGVWFWNTRLALQSRKDFTLGFSIQNSYTQSRMRRSELQLMQFGIDLRYFY